MSTIEKLNRLYQDSERADKEVYAEMRSNMLLVAGDHYTKKHNKTFVRLRQVNRLNDTQKLKLTKNHIHKISRYYVNAIIAGAPDVGITPNDEKNMQDRKAAELNSKVWEWSKRKNKIRQDVKKWAKSYFDVGEVAVKVIYHPEKGDFLGFEQMLDENDQPVFDAEGQPVANEEEPRFSGALEIEELHAFNIWRCVHSRDIEKSPYIGYRKMTPMDDLKLRYADDPKKLKAIDDAGGQEFIVFDANRSNYSVQQQQVLVKEIYYRPCKEYPMGYFYIFLDGIVLEEGELPYGKFPIVVKPFDRYGTSPRGRSLIKVVRPYQAEINRASSMVATNQITLGMDKVLYQAGSKLAPGALLPGVRGISFQGPAPQILPGRDGGQFFQYIDSQIKEMYSAVMLAEILEQDNAGLDAYKLLYQTASKKSKFKAYIEGFEEFIVEVVKLYLDLAKNYLSNEQILEAVGNEEVANIVHFRDSSPQSSQIKAEPESDNVDTLLGRQMTFDHLLQYAGSQLTREDVGKIMSNMPFINNKDLFADFTMNVENVENDMLALERGEQVQPSPNDDNEYYAKKLSHRMRKQDFKYLDPVIQQNYLQLLQLHEGEVTRKLQERKQAESDFIPTGGALITCSMQVPDGKGKTRQLRLPYEALMSLVNRLEAQGSSQAAFDQMNDTNLSSLVQQYQAQQAPPQVPQQPQPQQGPPMPQALPPGLVG